MTWNRIRPWLGLVVRLGLGVVWIIAAYDKLRDPRTFVQAVRAYDATPEWLSKAIGYGLPVLEMSIGILLVLGLVTRIVAMASSVLFVVFLIGIIQAAARGLQLNCGCFGGGGATDGGTTYTLDILRDIGLLILAVFLVLWPLTRLGLDEFISRNDRVEQPSAKRMRSDKGRAKYNALLEQRRREAASRNRWIGASVAAVVVLIAVIGIGVQSNRAKIAGSLTATHATVANGVVYGTKAPAVVDVYEDFGCPNCLAFEKAGQKALDAAVQANKAQVRFHLMNFLSSESPNDYSTRAANAALCASDLSVADFVKYHNLLYGSYKGKQVQPTEGTAGPTDAQLVSYGTAIGMTTAQQSSFGTCVSGETHKALVEALDDRASQNGVTGTPTIKVNGTSISGSTFPAMAAALEKAIDKAVASSSQKLTPSTAPLSGSPSSSGSPSLSGSSLPSVARTSGTG